MSARMSLWVRSLDPQFLQKFLSATAVGLFGAIIVIVVGGHFSPLMAGAGVVALMVTIGMVFSPTLALLVLTFSMPFERIGRFTDDFDSVAVSTSRILGVLALGSFMFHALTLKWKLRFGPAFWLYAGYVGMAFVTNWWAFSPEETFRDCFRVLGNLMFFFLLINMIRNYKLARVTLIVWLLANVASGLYAVYDYYSPARVSLEEVDMGLTSERLTSVVEDDSETRTLGTKVIRAFGTTAHPTLFGLNLTMTIPFFVWLIRIRDRWRWRLFWMSGLVLSTYNIFLSNTRAVMLLAAGTFAFVAIRKLWPLTAKWLAVLILVTIALLPLVPEDVYMRTLDPDMYTTTHSDSIRVRFKFWEKSWELIKDNWLTGIGIGDQTTIVKMVTDEVTGRITPDGLKASAHNEYIWVMVEVGILGYLLHWGFVGLVTWSSFKAAALFRAEKRSEEYWLMVAAQITMVGILCFAVQTEVFHFALKGWWLIAAISCSMLECARAGQGGPAAGVTRRLSDGD